MIKCTTCRNEKEVSQFMKREKMLSKCNECRIKAKKWRDKNKERISIYNKYTNEKKNNNKEVQTMVYAKKPSEEMWIEYKTQLDASKALNLRTSNINKVIKGHLKTTGGYEFKIETATVEKIETPSWEEIKKENEIQDKTKGQPSQQRINHETIDNVIGKKCCNCKEWQPLINYNKAKNHWDELRNDCKSCLVSYRKNNLNEISRKYSIYERKRKLVDPEFKLLKTLRSRLATALRSKNANKSKSTKELTGCDILFLKGYLEAKFTEGMSWENHGDWHVDHIRPCCSYDLTIEEEQKKCFHYTNLQPLWAKENLSKGGAYTEEEINEENNI